VYITKILYMYLGTSKGCLGNGESLEFHLLVFSQTMQTHVTVFSDNSTSHDPSVSSLDFFKITFTVTFLNYTGIFHIFDY